jgi:hypothetical protein
MSLNRCEHYLFEYIQTHKEEGQYWQGKVHSFTRKNLDIHEMAAELEQGLWAYYLERAGGSPKFAQGMPSKDLKRTSMRNLADHLIRLWVGVVPKKRSPQV